MKKKFTLTKQSLSSYFQTYPFEKAQVIKKLGQGSYGSVRLYTLTSGERVAIKRIRGNNNDGISSSTLREINSLMSVIGCENILQLLNIKHEILNNLTRVELMLTYHTSDLQKFCQTVNFLERVKYSNEIIQQLFNGLFQLYNRGILHRDIKPQNILIDYVYDSNTGKLLEIPKCYYPDFGLARQLACNTQQRNQNMTTEVYTANYRPPEIMVENDDYTDKADIWALGVTLVEYFSGKYLFDFSSMHLNEVVEIIFPKLTTPLQPTLENINLVK